MTGRPRPRGLVVPFAVLVAGSGLTACAATDRDTANATVCDAVMGRAGTLLDQARSQPPDPALRDTLTAVHDVLEVRDSDASDQMRGDALVLQLNLRSAQQELAAGGTPSADRLEQAVVTFRSRECT